MTRLQSVPTLRRAVALACAAGLAWLALAPATAAETPERRRRDRAPRPIVLGGGPLQPRESELLWLLGEMLAVAADNGTTAESCQDECLACAAGVIGIVAGTVGIAAACGGTIVTGGLSLAGCMATIIGTHGVVLSAALNCSHCDRCLDQPDPDTPPNDGLPDCEPCDPTDPLVDCPEIENDPCADEGEGEGPPPTP